MLNMMKYMFLVKRNRMSSSRTSARIVSCFNQAVERHQHQQRVDKWNELMDCLDGFFFGVQLKPVLVYAY